MHEKVKIIMASLFDIKESEINHDSSIDNVRGWDSLKHMEFIFAIEEEFEIDSLSAENIAQMRSYSEIIKILSSLIDD